MIHSAPANLTTSSATKSFTLTPQGSSSDSLNPPSLEIVIPKQPADVLLDGRVDEPSYMRRNLDRMVSSMGDDEDDDDGSLVPVESIVEADDSSYFMASAPNSVNTFATTRSLGDDFVMMSLGDEIVMVNSALGRCGEERQHG
jgi:hypothetical protein